MKALFLVMLSLGMVCPSFAKEKKKPQVDPVQWGMLSRADGCVIFKESHKTDVKFFGVAATEKKYNVLDVIETERYEMAQKHWVEDQDGLNQLQRLAVSDHLAMVKIEDGYSPALLDKARMICAGSLRPADSRPGQDAELQDR